MQPDVSDVHVNALLSQVSIAYMNMDDAYVADKVFPFIYHDKQTDIYLKYGRGSFLTDPGNAMIRAPGTNAGTTGYTVDTTSTFYALNFAIAHEIPDELRGNRDRIFDLDRDGTMLVTQAQSIRRERAFAADFMKTGVWTGSSTGSDITVSAQWSDYGASTPITDIRTEMRAILQNTGRNPNKLVLGKAVWDVLVDHPDFIERVKGGATTTQPAKVMRELFAQILGIDEVLVSEAIYNTAHENLTVSTSFVFGKHALLLYSPPNPGTMIPAAGYTFVWETMVNGRNAPHYIRKIREDRPKKDIIESQAYWDQVCTEPLAGAFFSSVVA